MRDADQLSCRCAAPNAPPDASHMPGMRAGVHIEGILAPAKLCWLRSQARCSNLHRSGSGNPVQRRASVLPLCQSQLLGDPAADGLPGDAGGDRHGAPPGADGDQPVRTGFVPYLRRHNARAGKDAAGRPGRTADHAGFFLHGHFIFKDHRETSWEEYQRSRIRLRRCGCRYLPGLADRLAGDRRCDHLGDPDLCRLLNCAAAGIDPVEEIPRLRQCAALRALFDFGDDCDVLFVKMLR